MYQGGVDHTTQTTFLDAELQQQQQEAQQPKVQQEQPAATNGTTGICQFTSFVVFLSRFELLSKP